MAIKLKQPRKRRSNKEHSDELYSSSVSEITAKRAINSGAAHVKRLRLQLGGYKSAVDLWDACCKYFAYVYESPIFAHETFKYQGEATVQAVPHARAMSERAMCFYIGITEEMWSAYVSSNDPAIQRVCQDARTVIYTQKYEGAYAGIFNPTVAVRDLNLVDKQDITHNVGNTLKEIFEDVDGKNTGLPSGES